MYCHTIDGRLSTVVGRWAMVPGRWSMLIGLCFLVNGRWSIVEIGGRQEIEPRNDREPFEGVGDWCQNRTFAITSVAEHCIPQN